MENRKVEIPIPHNEISRIYKEFSDLLKTCKSFNQFYGKVMRMDDPENPRIIEDFIRAIGAEPVIYAQRNECCGGYCTIKDKSFATDSVGINNEQLFKTYSPSTVVKVI